MPRDRPPAAAVARSEAETPTAQVGADRRVRPARAARRRPDRAAPARITAVLGANGAGKTTLLRTLSGLVRPTAGADPLRRATTSPASRSNRWSAAGMAHVPEGRGVVTELTVDENLRLGGLWRRDRAARQARSAEVYELFPPLAQRRRHAGHQLSGGERQMLALGRALMARPRLLLLDEPSLGLAPRVVAQIMALLRQLRDATGLTVLLVEQNVRSALSVADQGVVMSLGRVVVTADAGDAARRRGSAPRLPRLLTRATSDKEARLDRFVFLTVDGLSRGAVLRGVRAGPGADLARRADRQLRPGRDGRGRAPTWRYSVTAATGSYWLGFAAALVGRAGARRAWWNGRSMRFVEHAPPLNAVIVALGLVLRPPGGARHGLRQRVPAVAAPFSRDALHRRRASRCCRRYDLYVFAAVLVRRGRCWRCCSRRTRVGLRMRAVGVRARGVAAARRQRRPDAHPRLGARRRRRRAGRAC